MLQTVTDSFLQFCRGGAGAALKFLPAPQHWSCYRCFSSNSVIDDAEPLILLTTGMFL
jgi:hypothetical protein